MRAGPKWRVGGTWATSLVSVGCQFLASLVVTGGCGDDGRGGRQAPERSDARVRADGGVFQDAGAPGNDAGGRQDAGHHEDVPDHAGAIDVWTHVWCPDSQNSGTGFHRLASFDDLPNDPLGDGENNCYMEALDTSVFSSDSGPLHSCANLDHSKFSGYDCIDVTTGTQFEEALTTSDKVVIIVENDIQMDSSPFIAGQEESHVIIGLYDEATRRPVLVTSGPAVTSNLINWNPVSDPQALTVINLRIHTAAQCFSTGKKQGQGTYTFQSVTAKCGGRFIMGSFESPTDAAWDAPGYPDSVPDLTAWPIDDRYYFRQVMTRARASHSVYLDRAYLDWVEDSIVMLSFTSGKHAAKFEAQNVYLHNSIFTNTGIHNEAISDSEFSDQPRRSNLAALSLAACSRVIIDHVTVPYHYERAEANGTPIQWQLRDAVGAACDMPWGYYPNLYPTIAYHGPAYWLGAYYEETPFWDDSWWSSINDDDPYDPNMITSILTSNWIHLTAEDEQIIPYLHAVATTGTYPTTRADQGNAHNLFPPDEVPDGWKERQRVVLDNNCFDDGLLPENLSLNRVPDGMEDPNDPQKSAYDNTDRFVTVGTNRCSDANMVDGDVAAARDAFVSSLPQPPWIEW